MARIHRWMSSLVPNRTGKQSDRNMRTVDLERQCIDFDTWLQMNTDFYEVDDPISSLEAKKDYEKWRNGFNPIEEKNRKRIFGVWKSSTN